MKVSTLLGTALLCCTSVLSAQSITRVTPNTASVGDTVILDGAGLGGVATVRFQAIVGGFVGQWTVDQAVVSASATQVTVTVPSFGFAPPNAVPPGDPNGTVSIGGSQAKFFYQQATFVPPAYTEQQTATAGLGTTQSTGQGRAVVSFDIAQGAPTPGNKGFVIELENAVANSVTSLIVSAPSALPPLPIGDGQLIVTPPWIITPPLSIDAAGDASLNVPVGGPFGATLAAQWILLDNGLPGGVAVSNALTFSI